MVILKEILTRFLGQGAKLGLVFSFGLTVCATAYSQSINDDLKPKETVAKTTTAANNSTTTRPTGKSVKVKTKKNGGARKPVAVSPTTSVSPVSTAPAPTKFNGETSDQIIDRYMRFHQTSSVSERDWNSVIAQSEKLLRDNPNNQLAKAQSLIAQGHVALGQRQTAVAISQFKTASQILPGSSLPYYSLGLAYLTNGQAKTAETYFNSAIEKNKSLALAYKGLGDAATAQGQRDKGVKYFKKATELAVRDGNKMP